jgi:hypothetical protein
MRGRRQETEHIQVHPRIMEIMKDHVRYFKPTIPWPMVATANRVRRMSTSASSGRYLKIERSIGQVRRVHRSESFDPGWFGNSVVLVGM